MNALKQTTDYLKNYPKNALKETPPWAVKLRTAGIIVGTVGIALTTAPVTIPAALVTLGGYAIWAGGVLAAMAQGFSK